ncbi:hypothetical protein F0562_006201 [Nyssa sinensis]|uniref:Uncharacterized protein n=1 Tax=Nyssa sinensis TaxID=561372 RepID=A0A5J5AP01_9ASTE|nr:hypothetical protein F0562_006201 [Nyssa sinensis]
MANGSSITTEVDQSWQPKNGPISHPTINSNLGSNHHDLAMGPQLAIIRAMKQPCHVASGSYHQDDVLPTLPQIMAIVNSNKEESKPKAFKDFVGVVHPIDDADRGGHHSEALQFSSSILQLKKNSKGVSLSMGVNGSCLLNVAMGMPNIETHLLFRPPIQIVIFLNHGLSMFKNNYHEQRSSRSKNGKE